MKPEEVTTTALLLASAAVDPYPRNTVTVPLLIMRYWLPPRLVDAACTGEGAVVLAVKVTVLPIFVKALMPILASFLGRLRPPLSYQTLNRLCFPDTDDRPHYTE